MSLMTMGVGPGGFGVAAGGGDGTLAIVQQDVHVDNDAGDATQTITSATAGNFLVCMTCTGGASPLGTSPSDNISGGTNWTTVLSQNTVSTDINGFAFRFRIFTKVAEGGETTMTYTSTMDGDGFYTVWEISKTAGTFSADGTADIGTGTGATAWGPETGITLTGDKSMILMMAVSGAEATAASPYDTNAVNNDSSTVIYGTSSYANSLTGAQTLSSAFSSSSTGWIAGAIGIRAS